MRYKFFTSSESAWRGMYDAISAARESVYLEMYIFIDDMKAVNFLELLKTKARSRVRVRIILDSFGSAELSERAVKGLREAGAEVFFFSSILHRTHRKILIVDEEYAFIGGVNFHQSTKHWNDLVVGLHGRLITPVVRSFARAYALAGGHDPQVLSKNKKLPYLGKTENWFYEHFPSRGKKSLKKIYKEHIHNAAESLVFVTPYFMPKRWLAGVLHQAVLRGVRVEVLVPASTDYFTLDRVNYFYMHRLGKLGVQFYLSPSMNHAKAMLIDGKEALIGSQNLDVLSFGWNAEAGIFFSEPEPVQKLIEITEAWKREAQLFNTAAYKPAWYDRLLGPFIVFFTRIS